MMTSDWHDWKPGDKVAGPEGELEIVSVKREPNELVSGRYKVRLPDGSIVENYPGYLLRSAS